MANPCRRCRPLVLRRRPDYNLTQSWALALQEAGYDGIRYKARHDPRGQLVSIALFGSGKPPRSPSKTTTVSVDLIHEASTTFAITVLSPPPLATAVGQHDVEIYKHG